MDSLKNKKAQTIKDFFDNTLIYSKKTKLIRNWSTKGFYNNIFQNFLNNNNITPFSRRGSFGSVFAERLNRTIRDFLESPVFEKVDDNWIDVLSLITKHYKNRVSTSTNLTPIQCPLKTNEGYIDQNFVEKRKKIKPN